MTEYEYCNTIQIPSSVTKITYWFCEPNTKNFTLVPDYIKYINFSLCNNLESIEDTAFAFICGIKNILIDPLNPNFGLATNVGKGKVIVKKDKQTNECSLSDDNGCIANLVCGDISFPSTMTSISQSFDSCSSITSVYFLVQLTTSVLVTNADILYKKIEIDQNNPYYGLADDLSDKKTIKYFMELLKKWRTI